ncbi:hypothetical protein HPB50_014371 [Hyalomma asiaticum]|uniref:Uncharacterized protein n=1 Tax=Hyalomma asiaticum TaxID=266040 RepID=A0ACB7S6K8_HYAAI|nr:hypothetical protein HPB50_014371 [Hyalomma asiaticum]
MLQLERENPSLRNALEQLRAEIDEMKRAGQEQPVQRSLPPVTEGVETPTGTPMETPTETPALRRSAKKRALSKPILDEGLEELRAELRGFQSELRDALKALSKAVSAVNATVDSVESKITITDQLSGSAVRNVSPSADSSTVQTCHNSVQLAVRKEDTSEYISLGDLIVRLKAHTEKVTKTVRTDLDAPKMDSRVAHLLEAKRALKEDW